MFSSLKYHLHGEKADPIMIVTSRRGRQIFQLHQ